MKHNLEGIEAAIEECAAHEDGNFTCCLLSENAAYVSRKTYAKMFEIGDGETFCERLLDYSDEELRELRLLALSFLYEICRLKNNKKKSGF